MNEWQISIFDTDLSYLNEQCSFSCTGILAGMDEAKREVKLKIAATSSGTFGKSPRMLHAITQVLLDYNVLQ